MEGASFDAEGSRFSGMARCSRLARPETRDLGGRRAVTVAKAELDDALPLWRGFRQSRPGWQLRPPGAHLCGPGRRWYSAVNLRGAMDDQHRLYRHSTGYDR